MSTSPTTLFCLGLCLGLQVWLAQSGPLPKPSLRALPSSLVPLDRAVTIRCRGPPGVDLYRLEKLKPRKYEDQDSLFIPAMKTEHAGRYRCSYQIGSTWSPPSDHLELVATGVYDKPSLTALPSPEVSPGGDVTLQCQTQYGFDQFALYKEGGTGPDKRQEKWYQANFPMITVTSAHSGTYRCYSFSSATPYLWSAPSNPLVLTVAGASVTPSQLATETPYSVTRASAAPSQLATETPYSVTASPRRPVISAVSHLAPTVVSRNISVSPKGSSTPVGLARHHYSSENLVRICLGAGILILLAGIVAEDWHSRRKTLGHRLQPGHRPLPPLPRAAKSHGCQDAGQLYPCP